MSARSVHHEKIMSERKIPKIKLKNLKILSQPKPLINNVDKFEDYEKKYYEA